MAFFEGTGTLSQLTRYSKHRNLCFRERGKERGKGLQSKLASKQYSINRPELYFISKTLELQNSLLNS